MEIKKINVITCNEWDKFIEGVYEKPYQIQQQDECMERGLIEFEVPVPPMYYEDYEVDSIEEIVNGEERGVSFQAWLDRDPKEGLNNKDTSVESLRLWWYRNFYPDVSTIIDNLYKRGLIKEGKYAIHIDW